MRAFQTRPTRAGTATRAAALLVIALVALSPLRVGAHGGEDHGDAKPVAAQGIGPRLATGSDDFEIVALPSGRNGGQLRVYVNDASSNTPVRGATIDITRGDTTETASDVGEYYELAAPWVRTPGRSDLTFAVTVGQRSDLLIGSLEIPQPASIARHETIWDHLLPEGSGHVLSWALAALGVVALIASHRLFAATRPVQRLAIGATALLAIGSAAIGSAGWLRGSASPNSNVDTLLDQPDTARRLGDGAVFLPRPTQTLLEITTVRAAAVQPAQKTVRLLGQVIPDLNRSGLVQSLVPGRIEATEEGFVGIGSRVKAGDILGYLIPRVEFKDQSDILQTTGDLDRQVALAEAKLARLERLKGVIAESQIVDTRIEVDGLRKRRAAIRPLVPDRQVLTSPVDGIVSQANVVTGQTVDAQAVLFQVVDPNNLWVEALAFDPVSAAHVERAAREATARTGDGREGSLVFGGRSLALKQQAIPLRFKIKSGSFNVGEPVTVMAPIDASISAIALPRSALVRASNGQSVVWVHTGPERFEAKVVAMVPIDQDRIGITAGLEPEARVVTRGAELINQIR